MERIVHPELAAQDNQGLSTPAKANGGAPSPARITVAMAVESNL